MKIILLSRLASTNFAKINTHYWFLLVGISLSSGFFNTSSGQCNAYTTNTACTIAAPTVVGNSISCIPPANNGGRRNFVVTGMVAGATYRASNCGSGYDTQMTIRDAGGVLAGYNDDNGPACTGSAASIDFVPTTAGDYWIQLNRYDCDTVNALNGTITVTLIATAPAAPTNTTCATATTLACATTNLAGTTAGTSNTAHGTACTMSNYGVWYKFTGDGQQTTITSVGTGGFDQEMSISSGSCGTFTNIACLDVGAGNGTETYTFVSTVGVNYYIYIAYYGTGNTTGNFTISRTCTAAPTPPANATCATASSLPCATANLAGTTVNTPGTAHGTACTMSNYGVWYTFAGDGQQTTISSVGTGGFDQEMSISSGSCGTFTNLTCLDVGGTNGTESYTFTTTTGVNYYVYIAYYGTGNTTGTFTVSRTCTAAPTPPTNTTCATATSLPCPTSALAGSTINTPGTAHGTTCTMSNYGVWYTFVGDGQQTTITSVGTGGFDHEMSISSGSCGTFTNLACLDTAAGNGTETYNFTSTLGINYYVYIAYYGTGNTTGTFTISRTCTLPCNDGTGFGTTTLPCPAAVAGELGSGGLDATLNYCITSGCANLEVSYVAVGDTSSYTVAPITYAPPYQFDCLDNAVSVNVDDVWSPIVTLPFNFCFYGNPYTTCIIGSNGIINFDTANAGGYAGYAFSNNLPSTVGSLFANSIYGVYHDIDPGVGGEVGWELITLNTGCQALVAAWSNVPMFSDNSILYTGMMVLYENTNVIEVYVKEKRIDNNNVSPWNGGNAIIGIQNANATQAVVAPGRNGLDTNWTATLSNGTEEAWRFTPSGPSISTVTWYEGAGTTGPIVGTTNVINVCPTATTTYTVDVAYSLCDGSKLSKKDQTTVIVSPNKVWDGSVDNDWNKSDNWTPSGIPNSSDCVVIPNTTIKPVISGNGYNALSGTLSILNDARLTINPNSNLTGTNWVSVKPTGDFQIENNASLIQVNNVANIGNVTYKRNASLKKFDYAYWSSPVAGINVSNIAAPLVSGGIYRWNTTLPNGNNGQGNWEAASGNTMLAGKGYIVRSPDSFSATPSTLSGIFTGVPHNGDITFPIYRGSDTNTALHYGTNGIEINQYSDNWNLIGNPYPSSIRASQFLFDNSTKIEGNIRVWTHGTAPSGAFPNPFYGTFGANYSPNDYITYNFTGTSCCPLAEDDFFIGGGQGFFVQMKDALPSPSSDVVTFNNNLRNYAYGNSNFYRTSNQYTDQNQILNIERNRMWLDIMNASEQSSRILVGYIEGATMEWDSFFDANTNTGTAMNLYSLIDHSKFIIQGRALPFDVHDEVPLGCVIPTAGTYSIGIAGLDGLFENQDIFIKDTLLNTINDIKTAPYQFTSDSGKFDNRFSIVYLNNTLGNPNFGYENSVMVVTNDAITVHSGKEPMESIVVYDVLGRRLATYNNINATEFTLQDLLKNNTTLLLQIKLQNGTIVNEKVIY